MFTKEAYAVTRLITRVQEGGNATKHHIPRNTPVRVFFDITTSSLESGDRFKEVRDLIDEALPVIFKDPAAETDVPVDVNLLAIEIRSTFTFAIIDAHHDAYDFLTAHERQNNQLPVYRVSLRKRGLPLFRRYPPLDGPINVIVSELHRLNGYEVQPPYIRDYILGPAIYTNPRSLEMAAPKAEVSKEAEEEEVEGKVAEEKEAAEEVSNETA